MPSKEKLKCRQIPFVLKSGNPPTFSNKLRESNVISLVNQDRGRVEPFATIVDNAFERYTSELETNMDPFG